MPVVFRQRRIAFLKVTVSRLHFQVAGGGALNNIISLNTSQTILIRLFESVVSTTVLHGSFTWAMTKAMAEDLDVARRKMLRYILRIFRRKTMQNSEDTELEPWVDYLKRAARIIEKAESFFGMESWSVQAPMRKLAFA